MTPCEIRHLHSLVPSSIFRPNIFLGIPVYVLLRDQKPPTEQKAILCFTELLGFFTFTIVRYSREQQIEIFSRIPDDGSPKTK
jgi:hypothetical protein